MPAWGTEVKSWDAILLSSSRQCTAGNRLVTISQIGDDEAIGWIPTQSVRKSWYEFVSSLHHIMDSGWTDSSPEEKSLNQNIFLLFSSVSPVVTVLFISLSSWFQRSSFPMYTFWNFELLFHRWIVNVTTKLKIHLSNQCLRLVKISSQVEHFCFLRPAEYLQRKFEAQQYKLKVEKQLVSKIPNVWGSQEFSNCVSVHKCSWLLKSKFVPP